MINISIKRNKSDIVMNFSGHANFDIKGKDIICAGVSSLFCTLVIAMINIGESITIEGSNITVKSPSRKARLIIKTILIGLKEIQQSYPDYVKIAVDTRKQTAQKICEQVRTNHFANTFLLQRFASKGADKTDLTNRKKLQESGQTTGNCDDGNADIKLKEVFRVFKTKDEYQEHIDSIIGNRLKDNREKNEKLNKFDDVIKKLVSVFGAKDENELVEKLGPAAQVVLEQKSDDDEYNKFSEAVKSDIEALPDNQKAKVNSDELLQNEDFITLLASGLSVADAVDIILSSDEDASDKQTELSGDVKKDNKSDEKREQLIHRPAENALSAVGAARITKNAEYLTNDELADIVKRVARGEKIKF